MTRSDFKQWLYHFKQWLYGGQRPNWIAKILNRAWAAVVSSGVASNYNVTLEVTGRKSGRTVSLPVVVAVVDGQRYLVSMLGENVNWVHNVRAASGRAVLRSGGREEVHLEEVPAEHRAPILRAYLQRAPGARPHVSVNKDAPIAEFEKVAADFPVFRVVSHTTVQLSCSEANLRIQALKTNEKERTMIQQLGIVKHSSILDHAVVLRGRHLDRPKSVAANQYEQF